MSLRPGWATLYLASKQRAREVTEPKVLALQTGASEFGNQRGWVWQHALNPRQGQADLSPPWPANLTKAVNSRIRGEPCLKKIRCHRLTHCLMITSSHRHPMLITHTIKHGQPWGHMLVILAERGKGRGSGIQGHSWLLVILS